jgi:hypothetical protein
MTAPRWCLNCNKPIELAVTQPQPRLLRRNGRRSSAGSRRPSSETLDQVADVILTVRKQDETEESGLFKVTLR